MAAGRGKHEAGCVTDSRVTGTRSGLRNRQPGNGYKKRRVRAEVLSTLTRPRLSCKKTTLDTFQYQQLLHVHLTTKCTQSGAVLDCKHTGYLSLGELDFTPTRVHDDLNTFCASSQLLHNQKRTFDSRFWKNVLSTSSFNFQTNNSLSLSIANA